MFNFKKLLIISLLAIMSVQLLISFRSESPTFDEGTQINAGFEFLVNHDFRLDPFNPPLARELVAIPALFNKNRVLNDLNLFYPRLVVIIFTLSLGLLVYIFSKKLYGQSCAILALFLFVFEPNILANGHYALTDLIFTFFYVTAIYIFHVWQDRFTLKKIIIFGFVVGLLLSTKTTALSFFFIPIIVLYLFKHNFKRTLITGFTKKKFLYFFVFLIFCSTSLWGTYFFKFEPLLGYRFDTNRPAVKIAEHNDFVKLALNQPLPLGSYISSIKQVLVFNYSGLYRKDSMILGQVSHDGQPGYYFIPLIFIKTPLPLLLLFFIALILFRKKLKKDIILIIPIVIILFSVCISNTTIVYRYILPIIPLLIIYTSQIASINLKKSNFRKYFLVIMLGWFLVESTSSFPHYISYINLYLGGAKNGYTYVFDSNYDWGQGLIDLAEYQKKNNKNKLQLAYFGQAMPTKYGLNYERLRTYNTPTDNKPESKLRIDKDTTVAISATCWYLCGYNKSILKDMKPTEIIGGSILIFRF